MKSWWILINNIMKESLTKKLDFIVIGAGIAGLSCAYHLTKDGYSVMVFEKSDGKDNASYASTAEMNHDPDASWDRIISKFGIRGARYIWKLSEFSAQKLTKFAHRPGSEHFSTKRVPAHIFTYDQKGVTLLKKRFELYKKIGAQVTFTENAKSLHKNFRSSITIKNEGATNNQALLIALRAATHEQGGKVIYKTPVVDLKVNKRGVEVRTKKGNIFHTKHVILATGGIELINLPVKIGRERTFVVSYKKRNMDKLFSSSLLWDTAEPFHYIRSFVGKRLWVGGEDVAEESYTPSSDKRHIAALDKYSREVLALDSSYVLEKKKSWSGVFFPTARGLPYIGDVAGTPIKLALGFGGTGILMSFVSGYLIASWLKKKEMKYKPLFKIW